MTTETQVTKPAAMPKEIWRVVDEWPDYEVSSSGRVRREGRILRPQVSGSGYHFVTLCAKRRKKMAQVHRLVAFTFCGYGREVNHLDGNKFNNSAANLEWVNRSQNQRHAADIGLKARGAASHLCTKLSEVAALALLRLKGVISQSKAGKQFGVSQTYVGKIWRGEKWRHLQCPTQ